MGGFDFGSRETRDDDLFVGFRGVEAVEGWDDWCGAGTFVAWDERRWGRVFMREEGFETVKDRRHIFG